jgi:hypothetical protein
MWIPVKKEYILKDIEYCNDLLFDRPDCLRFWEYIKIQPEKWIEKTMGEDGGGFWVVGLIGKTAIYYNDIEEGYNLSSFSNYGEIDMYCAGQAELHDMVQSLYNEIEKTRKS